ncbi:MAG TPA: sugar ABC transporter permease [Streptosporangiaceae bacterium]|jgi:ABC-type sugar transport system permease subunit|nr:sugar ABC transporter permease [Streptosporangiaceae bacterium]
MAEYVWRRDRPLRGAAPRGTSLAAFVRRHKLAPYLLLAPGLAGIAVVLLWPLIQVGTYAFQNYGLPQITGAEPTQWVGLGNFNTTFADPEFWLSLRTTMFFAAVVVPVTLVTGTLVGLLLHRLGKKMAAFVSTAALLAWATPPIAASVLFYWLFNPDGGLVDWALSKLPNWLVGSTDWAGFNWTTSGALPAYTVIAILVVWQSFPFIAVTVLAGLKTVPAELYEAARVDGATPFRAFWRITYPLLKPIFLVLLLLSVIWDFNVFAQSYIITGFPGNRDEFNLSLYIYDKGFQFPPSYGLGGALALIFTLILLVVTVGYVRASVRQGALT